MTSFEMQIRGSNGAIKILQWRPRRSVGRFFHRVFERRPRPQLPRGNAGFLGRVPWYAGRPAGCSRRPDSRMDGLPRNCSYQCDSSRSSGPSQQLAPGNSFLIPRAIIIHGYSFIAPPVPPGDHPAHKIPAQASSPGAGFGHPRQCCYRLFYWLLTKRR